MHSTKTGVWQAEGHVMLMLLLTLTTRTHLDLRLTRSMTLSVTGVPLHRQSSGPATACWMPHVSHGSLLLLDAARITHRSPQPAQPSCLHTDTRQHPRA